MDIYNKTVGTVIQMVCSDYANAMRELREDDAKECMGYYCALMDCIEYFKAIKEMSRMSSEELIEKFRSDPGDSCIYPKQGG